MQFIYSDIKLTWITIVLSSILMYIYYNNIIIYTDKLTKLLNQRSYQSQIELISEPTMVLLLDVDDFKDVNDNYGHHFGDIVLELIGKLIKETYHKYGFCYRIGGDEFCVLLSEYNKLQELNRSLIAKVKSKREEDPRFPTVSIGFALYQPGCNASILDTIQEADNNMYTVKNELKKKRNKNTIG